MSASLALSQGVGRLDGSTNVVQCSGLPPDFACWCDGHYGCEAGRRSPSLCGLSSYEGCGLFYFLEAEGNGGSQEHSGGHCHHQHWCGALGRPQPEQGTQAASAGQPKSLANQRDCPCKNPPVKHSKANPLGHHLGHTSSLTFSFYQGAGRGARFLSSMGLPCSLGLTGTPWNEQLKGSQGIPTSTGAPVWKRCGETTLLGSLNSNHTVFGCKSTA